MSFEQFSRSRTYFCDGYELQHQEEFVIEQKSFLSSFPLSSKNVSHIYRAKSFAVVELKLHLYFLEESFIKAWRLRQAHNYIKAHRKQIPLLRNCGVPQWAQKVSRLIIFLLEIFFLLLLSSSNSLEVLVCLLEQILN